MRSAYVMPADLAYVIVEPAAGQELRIFLLRLPSGNPVVLLGVSALIWLVAVEGDSDVAETVAEAVGKSVAEIVDTVHAYLDDLATRGLLQRQAPPE